MGAKRTDLLRGTLDLLILKSTVTGAIAWSRRLPTHRANHPGRLSGELWVDLPVAAPHGREGMGGSRVACFGKQSPGEILPADCLRAGAAQGRGTGLEPDGQDHDGGGGIRLNLDGRYHAKSNRQFVSEPLRQKHG